jgi:hypothetical protein
MLVDASWRVRRPRPIKREIPIDIQAFSAFAGVSSDFGLAVLVERMVGRRQ